MTSNLGATTYGSTSLGFGTEQSEDERHNAKVIAAVRGAMAPELVNRLDAIAVFNPLDAQVIAEIAEREVDAVFDRLRSRGLDLEIANDAVDLLARTGYDPAFGARHLQRNIEQILLEPLAGLEPGRWRAEVTNDKIVWSPT